MQSEAVSFLINKTEMHTGENTPAAEQRPDATIDPTVWVDDHGDYLFRYAVVRLRDETAAEDMVQETLLSAILVLRWAFDREDVADRHPQAQDH